jgi:hypothetical protein
VVLDDVPVMVRLARVPCQWYEDGNTKNAAGKTSAIIYLKSVRHLRQLGEYRAVAVPLAKGGLWFLITRLPNETDSERQ